MTDTTPCDRPGCDVIRVRQSGQPPSWFKRHRYCSKDCWHMAVKDDPRCTKDKARVCKGKGCTNELVRRPGEGRGSFLARICCSRRCAGTMRRNYTGSRDSARGALVSPVEILVPAMFDPWCPPPNDARFW